MPLRIAHGCFSARDLVSSLTHQLNFAGHQHRVHRFFGPRSCGGGRMNSPRRGDRVNRLSGSERQDSRLDRLSRFGFQLSLSIGTPARDPSSTDLTTFGVAPIAPSRAEAPLRAPFDTSSTFPLTPSEFRKCDGRLESGTLASTLLPLCLVASRPEIPGHLHR